MTILEKTPTRLVVQSGPNAGRFMLALVMVLFSGAIFLTGQSPVFACQRQADGTGQCTLTEYYLITTTAQSFKLDAITNARVYVTYGGTSSRPRTFYKLTIQVANSVIPLANNNHPEQYQSADRINAFLTDPNQRELEIKPNANVNLLPFGLVFAATVIGLGGGALLISTYIFDQIAGQFIIQKQWLFTAATPYPLDQVRDLELEVRPATRRQPEQKIVHIVFRSGLRIATPLPYELGLISTIRAYLKPIHPVVAPELETDKPIRPTAKPVRRVKYRRAKRPNHDQ
jgi:hypothetical protein